MLPNLLAPFSQVKGVFVNGCVERGVGSRFRRQAHAHNHPSDPYFGWICVLSYRRLFTQSGGLSQLILHEIAHILTPKHGHDDAWRAMARNIGYRVRTHEEKRVRAA